MKKLTSAIIFLIAILIILVGCSKGNGIKPEENQVNKKIIGTWKHQEVPSLPHYSSWVITFNENGTYKTESDTYETADSGTKSHTEAFGKKGTYVLSEDKILFRSDTDQSRTEIYEILEANDQTQLVFKDSNGNNKSSIGIDGVIYDLMFIKEN